MNYIPERPMSADIIKYSTINGVGVEYSAKALRTAWLEESALKLDMALSGIDTRLVALAQQVADIQKEIHNA